MLYLSKKYSKYWRHWNEWYANQHTLTNVTLWAYLAGFCNFHQNIPYEISLLQKVLKPLLHWWGLPNWRFSHLIPVFQIKLHVFITQNNKLIVWRRCFPCTNSTPNWNIIPTAIEIARSDWKSRRPSTRGILRLRVGTWRVAFRVWSIIRTSHFDPRHIIRTWMNSMAIDRSHHMLSSMRRRNSFRRPRVLSSVRNSSIRIPTAFIFDGLLGRRLIQTGYIVVKWFRMSQRRPTTAECTWRGWSMRMMLIGRRQWWSSTADAKVPIAFIGKLSHRRSLRLRSLRLHTY